MSDDSSGMLAGLLAFIGLIVWYFLF